MKQYLDLMRKIRDQGRVKSDRTGVGTKSIFGTQMRFDLREGFPLVTTKKIHLKSVIHELLWFLNGDTNIKYLNDHGVTIWDEWADEQGDLGRIYGKQWKNWRTPADGNRPEIDQISNLITLLKEDPDSRRLIVTAWNPGELHQMKLAPCHCLFQMWTSEMTDNERRHAWSQKNGCSFASYSSIDTHKQLDSLGVPKRYLSCQLYQRSCDFFLGVPFNIASYSLLTMMIASVVGMEPYEFIWTGGDTHLYLNHMEQVEEQLRREPYQLPKMEIFPKGNINNFTLDDFLLTNYISHPKIIAPIAV